MRVDYLEIKNHFDKSRHSDSKSRVYSDLLCKIEGFIDPKEMIGFYPKNLFVTGNDLEVYAIFKDKILKARILEDMKMEITILKFKQLVDFKYECKSNSEEFHRVTMKFENGETMILDNIEDSNDNWKLDFGDEIKELVRHLILVQ